MCHHDCKKLIPGSTLTMEDAYQKTLWKIRDLQHSSMNIMELWECEYDLMLCEDEKIKEFVDALDYKPPLNPRNAFFGGRINVTCLYNAKPGEQIKWLRLQLGWEMTTALLKEKIGIHLAIVAEGF